MIIGHMTTWMMCCIHLGDALHHTEVEAGGETDGHAKSCDVGRPPPVEARVEELEPFEVEPRQKSRVGLERVAWEGVVFLFLFA